MASIRQRAGRWQARIARQGYPAQVRTFDSKSDAERWARSVETEMDRGQFSDPATSLRTTLRDVVLRYLVEVTPGMKSAEEDGFRLRALARRPIAGLSMANLTPARVAAYRDERLREVSAATVIRELAYLSAIVNHARREWGIAISNPVSLVRKPATPPGRTRVLSAAEEELLLRHLRSSRTNAWVPPLVELALATGMRRSELLALTWPHVCLTARTAFLPDTKNGTARTVPLSTRAATILAGLPRGEVPLVFPISAECLAQAFRRAVLRTGLRDLRFHDLRHTAISAMAEKLPNVIELSAVSGHKSLAMLKRYYHPSASDLARKLG